MKRILFFVSIPLLLAACHSGPSEAEKAAQAALIRQHTIDSMNLVESKKREEALKKERDEARVAAAESGPTQPENTKKKKKWSNTAKGAVIGAGAGAVAGAVLDKNNRGAGAVIGGLAGAGVGAGTGAVIDHKKKQQKATSGQ
jgi:hypothetical protein